MTYSHRHTPSDTSRLIFTLLYTLSASTSALAAYSYANSTYQQPSSDQYDYSSAISDIIGDESGSSVSSSSLSDYIVNLSSKSNSKSNSNSDVSFIYSSGPQDQDEDDSYSDIDLDDLAFSGVDLSSGVYDPDTDLFYDDGTSEGDDYGSYYGSYYVTAGFPEAALDYQNGGDGDGGDDGGWYRDRDRDRDRGGGGRYDDDVDRRVGMFTKGGTTYVVDVFSGKTRTITLLGGTSTYTFQTVSVKQAERTSKVVSYVYSFQLPTPTKEPIRKYEHERRTRRKWVPKRETRRRYRKITYPPIVYRLLSKERYEKGMWKTLISESIAHLKTILGPVKTAPQLFLTTIMEVKTITLHSGIWLVHFTEHVPELITLTAKAVTHTYVNREDITVTVHGERLTKWQSIIITVIDGITITEYVGNSYTITLGGTNYVTQDEGEGDETMYLTQTTGSDYGTDTDWLKHHDRRERDRKKGTRARPHNVWHPVTATPVVRTQASPGIFSYTTTISTEVTFTVGPDKKTTPERIIHIETPQTTITSTQFTTGTQYSSPVTLETIQTYTVYIPGVTTPEIIYHVGVPPSPTPEPTSSSSSSSSLPQSAAAAAAVATVVSAQLKNSLPYRRPHPHLQPPNISM